MTAKKQTKPCEEVGAKPFICYWVVNGQCAAYNPSVEIDGDERYPLFAKTSSVPIDFCISHRIIRNDVDAVFNRNIFTMKYESARKKITKKQEKEADQSGSSKNKDAVDGVQTDKESGGLF